jgi:NADP-dependent 3-hydroxy acid dehydrogenase YdfG
MTMANHALAGTVAAITGGGRGIGRATAAALVREGAHVAIGDVDEAAAKEAARELGGTAMGFGVDVCDRASFAEFLRQAADALGPVDVLVNNAGIMPLGRFVDESDDTTRTVVDVNLHGVLTGMKLAIPPMLSRGRGHVVNLASIAGKSGFPGGVTYCATKHAVVGASEAVRAELRGSGVEVSVICPSVVNTDLAAGLTSKRVQILEPDAVANAIVRTLQRPRFETYVPRVVGVLHLVTNVMPRRVRERVADLLGADKVLVEVDVARRVEYETRAAERSRAS